MAEEKNGGTNYKKLLIRIGSNFVDMTPCVTISFYKQSQGYVAAQIILNNGRALHLPIEDKNDFCHVLMQLEDYIPNKRMTLNNIKDFIKKIEDEDVSLYKTYDIDKNTLDDDDDDIDEDKDDNDSTTLF